MTPRNDVLSVLFVGAHFARPRGGLGRYEVELLRALDQSDACSIQPTTLAQDSTIRRGRLATAVNPLLSRSPFRQLADHVHDTPDSTDIVHFANQQMGGSILAFRRKQRRGVLPEAQVVVTIHDLFFEAVRRRADLADLAPHRTLAGRAYDWLNLRGLLAADHIVVNSRATASDTSTFLGVPAADITITPLGIDHQCTGHDATRASKDPLGIREEFGLPPDARLLLYVGSLDGRKNLEVVVRAIHELGRRGMRALLMVVGSARAPTKSRTALEALGAGSVRMLGHVEEEVLRTLYASADAFVFPSRFEGFGFPVLEAMRHGCPVVASDASALPETVGDAGLLVSPADASAWADALHRLLTDSRLRTELVERGAARAQCFTWRRTANATLDAYRKTIAA